MTADNLNTRNGYFSRENLIDIKYEYSGADGVGNEVVASCLSNSHTRAPTKEPNTGEIKDIN